MSHVLFCKKVMFLLNIFFFYVILLLLEKKKKKKAKKSYIKQLQMCMKLSGNELDKITSENWF